MCLNIPKKISMIKKIIINLVIPKLKGRICLDIIAIVKEQRKLLLQNQSIINKKIKACDKFLKEMKKLLEDDKNELQEKVDEILKKES